MIAKLREWANFKHGPLYSGAADVIVFGYFVWAVATWPADGLRVLETLTRALQHPEVGVRLAALGGMALGLYVGYYVAVELVAWALRGLVWLFGWWVRQIGRAIGGLPGYWENR